MRIPEKLQAIAADIDLAVDYRPRVAKRKNGWPVTSAKPFHLVWKDGGHPVACFATLDQLERNLRGRAGC